jgi:tRNA threonylcarbamoyl adenosine modification protein (Sua5/YciO/YrdC/YwlC family)
VAQFFSVHPDNPQLRLIRQTAAIIKAGGVIAYPTDSCYALGGQLGDKSVMTRIRTIRQVDEHHHFTLMCRDLTEVSRYAKLDNTQYRLLKAITPGCYTFIFQATREVPRRLQHPKRNTIGVRIPDHPIAQALLAELNEPLLSSTLIMPGEELPLNDASEIRARLEHHVELVLDGGACGLEMSTVIDLTGDAPNLVRQGKGSLVPFGIAHG